LIVADASVLAPALADDGPQGDRARSRLSGETIAVPALADLEVASVLRRAALEDRLDDRRSRQALADLAALPMRRAPHVALLERIWELRENVTVYDGAYVALAEALDVRLVTADQRLGRATGLQCQLELLEPGDGRADAGR
jgi:predicted nucleic acid-binding protein